MHPAKLRDLANARVIHSYSHYKHRLFSENRLRLNECMRLSSFFLVDKYKGLKPWCNVGKSVILCQQVGNLKKLIH